MKIGGYWFLASMVLLATPATADPQFGALELLCVPAAAHFSARSTSYDGNDPTDMMPKSDGTYFANSVSGEDADGRRLVTQCEVAGAKYILTRTFVNTPHASGMCGGTDWASFELTRNGRKVADFTSGCNSILLLVDGHAMNLCVEGFGAKPWDCRQLLWETGTDEHEVLSGPFSGGWRD